MTSEPANAWIETSDGERIACLLERIGPREWQATPVRDVDFDDIAAAGVDMLPANGAISFVLPGQEE
jgi:hypothetical protein